MSNGNSAAGFTLIEVLAALAITLIALSVLSGGIAGALRSAESTAILDRAASAAESRLAAITMPQTVLGERAGQDPGGWRWRTRVALVNAAPSPGTGRKGLWSRGTGLYTVSVTVFWRQGRTERSLELHSARLGPIPGGNDGP